MNGPDVPYETSTAEEVEELGPREAAALLDDSSRRARRRLDIRPPLVMVLGAAAVLFSYGVIWLSVRGQHPYSGPSGTALAVLYATLIVFGAAIAVVLRRATTGVGGRSSRRRRAQGITFATIWILVYVFQGALHHAGASHAIAYGIYPAAAPVIIVGGAAAAYELARGDWGWSLFALAAAALAGLAAYTGPANVWGVIGIGLCLLLLGRAASRVWQLQRPAWARTYGH